MMTGDLDAIIAQYGVSRISLQNGRLHASDRANGRSYVTFSAEEKADMLTGDLDAKILQYGVSRHSLLNARLKANLRARIY